MIVILTYDAPHRKTQDVALRLMALGHDFTVVAVPWVDRKPRKFLYAHRPAEMTWPCDPMLDPVDFFRNIGKDYAVIPKDQLHSRLRYIEPSVVVIGGAGILETRVVNDFDVLNVHPGLLPQSRGLDILKWTILDLKKVGVTAHICNEETDLGWRICERLIPVFPTDTFHAFAMRQYEQEIALLGEAIRMFQPGTRSCHDLIEAGDTVAMKRMGRRVESGLLADFERYKLVFSGKMWAV